MPEFDSQVRLVMLVPSVVSPEFTAIDAPDPILFSFSNRVVHVGLVYGEASSNDVSSNP